MRLLHPATLLLPVALPSSSSFPAAACVSAFSAPASFSHRGPAAAIAPSRGAMIANQFAGEGDGDDGDDGDVGAAANFASERRRKFLRAAIATPLAVASSSPSPPRSASASERPPPIIPLVTTAKRLRAVPTFTIVDGNGVPFHTYDKDSAGGFGYFFTSYTSAEYVLDDAKKAFSKAKTEAENKKEAGEQGAIGEDGGGDVPDAWGQAQIVTIPLDVAMQLSVKKTKSVAQNGKGKSFDTFYQVIPETSDLNAALRMDSGPRYSERGRVPLFYVDGLTLPLSGGGAVNPVYFRIKDLKAEWTKQYPDKEPPTIKVRELNETFRSMIRPGGKDESVRDLVFVPIPESVEKARGAGRSYKLGEMILTK